MSLCRRWIQEIQGKEPPPPEQRSSCSAKNRAVDTDPPVLGHWSTPQLCSCRFGSINWEKEWKNYRIASPRKYFQPFRWPHHWRAGQKNPRDCWQKVFIFQRSVLFLNPSKSLIVIFKYHLGLKYNMTLTLFITLQFKLNPQGQHAWLYFVLWSPQKAPLGARGCLSLWHSGEVTKENSRAYFGTRIG